MVRVLLGSFSFSQIILIDVKNPASSQVKKYLLPLFHHVERLVSTVEGIRFYRRISSLLWGNLSRLEGVLSTVEDVNHHWSIICNFSFSQKLCRYQEFIYSIKPYSFLVQLLSGT